MSCQITYRAAARIKRHGLLVYPLEGFGLLLGETDAEGTRVLAALPVGKTQRWYKAEGRYADTERAVVLATQTFASWGLRPVGRYCSVGYSWDGGEGVVRDRTPPCEQAPILLLYPVDGGEAIYGYRMYHWTGEVWRNQAYQQTASRPESPRRNPNRMNTAWNRAWGVLDYGNGYRPEADTQPY